MAEGNDWKRIRKQKLSRRNLLEVSGRAGLGAAGIALVGCGDDDDDAQPQTVAEQQQQQQDQPQRADQPQQQEQQQAAAQQATVSEQRPRGGTLRAGWAGSSPATHQAPYGATPETIFYPALWDTLTKYSPDGLDPQPHLAESWEFNDDQTMIQIHLRPGLEFHDGKPMTAEEVKKSLERMDDDDVQNSQVRSIYNKYVSQATAIDKTTLQLDLDWPGTVIFDVLNWAQIHDADNIAELDGYTRVNASGPFKFDVDAYEVDVFARAERFENFYDPASLDAIEWNIFQDSESMTLALQNGELDITHHLPKQWYKSFDEDDNFDLLLAPPTGSIWVLGMVGEGRGGGHPMMDNPKARQAIYRTIDRERIVAEIFEGLSETKNVLWPSFSPAYDADADYQYFDLDEAKRLITEAGYPDGTPNIKIACFGNNEEALSIAQIIQQDAAVAGINLEPESVEAAAWIDRFLSGTHPGAYLSFYGFYAMHPQSLPVMNFQMRIPNSCAYDTPHYQAMIDGWATADSPAKRQALIDEFNRILDEEPWVAPICTYSEAWAAHSSVKGLSQDLTGNLRMRDAYLEAT